MALFDGKVAVVTGASRGIGKAAALALGQEGAAVVCAGRTTDAEPAKIPGTNEETARNVVARGGRAIAVRCDVRDEANVESLRKTTIEAFGRCDILVNNAGISFPGNVLDLSQKRWDLVMDVNLRGPLLTFRAFAPHMIGAGGGTVINVSSAASTLSVAPGRVSYSVSKAALDKLTMGLAAEVRQYKIHCISFGLELLIRTEGIALVLPDDGPDVAGGWHSPDVAAAAIVWLARFPERYSGRVVTVGQLTEDYKQDQQNRVPE
ncbi:MAG: SDR family NAD(P)-dependent oxidoreductase [Chloroflexi bacterium]|nr:SDR family NAD(P)-dependent oxidoreductase [Chloroflexota bacterium]